MPRSAVGPLAQRRRLNFDESVAAAVRPSERAAMPGGAAAPGVTFEPDLYPPRNSRSLVLTDQGASAGGANSLLVLPGLRQQIDRGYVGVFRQMTLFADAPTINTRVTWSVLVDGIPAPGLNALTMLFRTASSLSLTFDTLRLSVPSQKQVSVAILNVDGAVHVLGAQLVGWMYVPAPEAG